MRVAFLTGQYVTQKNDYGGVGSYIAKMTVALKENGHESEIFVLSSSTGTGYDHNGIRINKVKIPDGFVYRGARKLLRIAVGKELWQILENIIHAFLLNAAFEKRDAEHKFQIIQSANYPQTGIFIRKKRERKHYLRLSTSRLLFDKASLRPIRLSQKIIEKIDLFCIKKADYTYSPSEYLSNYFNSEYGVKVLVVRPPAVLSIERNKEPSTKLPDKFLIHFGVLGLRKGTDFVAEALEKAWLTRPDLKMVWVGRYSIDLEDSIHTTLENYKDRILWLGKLPSAELYAILNKAVAAVLPSRADNIPNTVVESLLLGIPVIGFSDASLDELVESGKNGKLVPFGDTNALSEAMISAWDGDSDWTHKKYNGSLIKEEMKPENAIKNFINLANDKLAT